MMKIKEIDLHLYPYAQQKNADNDLDVSKKTVLYTDLVSHAFVSFLGLLFRYTCLFSRYMGLFFRNIGLFSRYTVEGQIYS